MDMRLQVLLPTRRLLECRIMKFVGDGANGSFCLLPRHIDFVTAMRAGISSATMEDGTEHLIGHSTGLLVKSGREVSLVVQHGIVGDCLEELQQVVSEHFQSIDEHERSAVATIARLEADFVRRYIDLENRQHV